LESSQVISCCHCAWEIYASEGDIQSEYGYNLYRVIDNLYARIYKEQNTYEH